MQTSPDLSSPAGSTAHHPEEVHRLTFDALPLSPEVREALRVMGYEHPTPVQLAVWEPVTRGRDAVVQARTGTGKTASFGLPIIDHIVKRSVPEVQALVLCPTRELALQVAAEVTKLASKKDTKILPIYGGAGMEKQVQGIEDGAQVVVGTPGRVLDHIRRGTLRTGAIRLLVLDEADEMLSMGFERELTAILETLPSTRQTLLFSATVPPDIERIARSKLKTPEFVTLSGDHIGALEIDHFVYMVPTDKLGTLARIIEVENPESAVVFCNTKDDTETVAAALQQRGYDADWLNGDLPQGEREKVMTKTREGRLRFLVATDVAARGIDISHLTHVINYDFPQDAESYVHRTGRTGRAGRTGTAITLIAPRDIGGLYLLRLTYKIKPIERQIPTAGEIKTRAEADLVSMLAEAYVPRGAAAEDRALARRLLTHDQAEGIIAGLLREHLAARPQAQEEASQARRSELPPKIEVPAEAPAAKSADRPIGRRRDRDDKRPLRSARDGREGGDVRDNDRPRDHDRPRDDRPRDDRPRDDRPRDDRPRDDRPRDDRPRDDRPRDDRPRDDRPRDDRRRGTPAHAAREPRVAPTSQARPAEFTTWQPPEEEGDDEPLFAPKPNAAAPTGRATPASSAPASPAPASAAPISPGPTAATATSASEAKTEPIHAAVAPTPARDEAPIDGAELFVSVGRRDGVRAQDLLRVFAETAGLDGATVQRIRVRDRHSFVSIRKQDVESALTKLNGTLFAGRTLHVEIARETQPKSV